MSTSEKYLATLYPSMPPQLNIKISMSQDCKNQKSHEGQSKEFSELAKKTSILRSH
jgi:hypothetical protein